MSADSIKAGGAVVTIGADTNPLSKAIEEAKSKIQKFGESMQNMGQNIGMAAGIIGGIGAAIAAPFAAGLALLVDAVGPIAAVARQTGMSFEEVQDTAAGFRISMENMPSIIGKMSAAIVDARNPMSQAARDFAELGLNMDELNAAGPAQQLAMISSAISRVSDGARRIDLQRSLLSRDLGAINIGPGADERIARNRELGGVISDQDKNAALDYAKAQRELGIATKGISIVMGAIFAPVMKQVAEYMLGIIMTVRNWVDNNRALLAVIIRVGAVLGIIGSLLAMDAVRLMVVGKIIAFVGASIAPVIAAVSGLAAVALPLIAILAMAAVQGFIIWKVFDAFEISISATYDAIVEFISGVIDSVDWISVLTAALISMAPFLAIAFGPAIVGIGLAIGAFYLLFEVIDYLADHWEEITGTIIEFWNGFVEGVMAGARIVFNVFDFLMSGLLSVTINVFGYIVDAVMLVFNELRGIVEGGVDAITSIVGDMSIAFGAIGDFISAGDWAAAFDVAMIALRLAWERTKNWLIDSWYRVTFIFGSAWDGVVNSLYGVLEPVVRSIVDLLYGLIEGIQSALNSVINGINAAIMRLPARLRPALLGNVDLVGSGRADAMAALDAAFAPQAQRVQGAANRGEQDFLEAELDTLRIEAEMAGWARGAAAGGPTGPNAALSFGTGVGSFSAAGLSGIGASSAAERTATAVEEALPVLRQIRDGVENDEGGIVAS